MNFKRNPILSFMWAAFLSAVLGACAAGNLGDGTEQEEAVFKSRMIAVLNGLPESARDRVAAEMGQAAGKKLVFTHSSRVEWNASVTQSSRNWRQGRRTRDESVRTGSSTRDTKAPTWYSISRIRRPGSAAPRRDRPRAGLPYRHYPGAGLGRLARRRTFPHQPRQRMVLFDSPFGHREQRRHRLSGAGRLVLARQPRQPRRPPQAARHGGGQRQRSVRGRAHRLAQGPDDLPGPRRRRVRGEANDSRFPVFPRGCQADGRLQG